MSTDSPVEILVVEDDEVTAELERVALKRAGMLAHKTNRVMTAKELLSQQSFAAVVLDYQLPDGEPWEVLEVARALTPRVPVVLVTAMGNESIVAEALRRGAADYVRKSATFWNDLGSVVGRVVRMAQEEERLRRSGMLFELIANNGQDLIVTFDHHGVIRYVSPACRAMLGYEASQLIGRKMSELLHPDDLAGSFFAVGRDHQASAAVRDLARCRRNDGRYAWLESDLRAIVDAQGSVAEVIGISRDVSERVAAQQSVELALQEKIALLQEVQHRVRNNLQVIISLLTLQISRTRQDDVQAALSELRGRILAISLAHQLLYQQNDFARLDFGEYLRQLADLATAAAPLGTVRIHVHEPAGRLRLAFGQAIPAGLVVNELLRNALAHAFPDDRQGAIDVTFGREESGDWLVRVADDGVGMADDLHIERATTLGFQLVRILVEQLRGRLQRCTHPGTCFEIRFSDAESGSEREGP